MLLLIFRNYVKHAELLWLHLHLKGKDVVLRLNLSTRKLWYAHLLKVFNLCTLKL
jgi:hypothetical protein